MREFQYLNKVLIRAICISAGCKQKDNFIGILTKNLNHAQFTDIVPLGKHTYSHLLMRKIFVNSMAEHKDSTKLLWSYPS